MSRHKSKSIAHATATAVVDRPVAASAPVDLQPPDWLRIDTSTIGCGQWKLKAWDIRAAAPIVSYEGRGSAELREARAKAILHFTGGVE